MFKDREAAGKLLGRATQEALRQRTDERPARTIVVAVSRGGVMVAKEVAISLHASLTILASKTITAPSQPEKALAVVTSRGVAATGETYDESVEGLPSYVRNQELILCKLAKTLEEHWLSAAKLQPPPLSGRKVVLVNDGCITGLIELAVLKSIRLEKPRCVFVAAPIVSTAAERALKYECDGVIALSSPDQMKSVLEHYERYDHVDDGMIIAALDAANL